MDDAFAPPEREVPYAPGYTPVGGLARVLGVLLWMTAVLQLFSGVLLAGFELTSTQPLSGPDPAPVEWVLGGAAALGRIGGLGAFVLAALAWMVWQRQCAVGLRRLGVVSRVAAPLSWAWWWVPVLNFIVPYYVVKELWLRSDPGGARGVAARPDVPAVLPLWWATWLGWTLFPLLGGMLDRASPSAIPSALGACSLLVSAWCGARLVREVSRRLDARAARLAA